LFAGDLQHDVALRIDRLGPSIGQYHIGIIIESFNTSLEESWGQEIVVGCPLEIEASPKFENVIVIGCRA